MSAPDNISVLNNSVFVEGKNSNISVPSALHGTERILMTAGTKEFSIFTHLYPNNVVVMVHRTDEGTTFFSNAPLEKVDNQGVSVTMP